MISASISTCHTRSIPVNLKLMLCSAISLSYGAVKSKGGGGQMSLGQKPKYIAKLSPNSSFSWAEFSFNFDFPHPPTALLRLYKPSLRRRPPLLCKWKATSNLLKMEDDLNFIFKMKNELKFSENERQPHFFC